MPAIRPSQEDCLDRPQREAAPGFRLWRTRSVLVGVAVVLVTLAVPSIASAVTWTGQGDGTSWDDGKNWSSSQVPEADDEVTIGPQPPGNVKLNGNRRVKGLTLNTGGYIPVSRS